MKILEFKNQGIYIILNKVTEDCYIGHSTNIGNRITKHISLLKNNKHDNHLLQKAFNEYGEDNFKIGVLEYCKTHLKQKEQFYVNKINPLYNITKEVIYNTPSIESRKKMSETRLKLFKENKLKPNGAKPILCYDLENNFICEFESTYDAVRQLKICRTSVQKVLYGKWNQTNGYKFSFK